MIVLSLFDGMSCGYEALKRAGIPVTKYYASEVDKYAIQIAKKNHPDIIHLGDVQNWKEWDIEAPDLIIGGSPCQGFSFAGKQLAFDDPRSQLFFTMMDIVGHYKPAYRLLENVNMKADYLDIISDYMGVENVKLNSSLVSAQSRNRHYWCNWSIEAPKDKGILLKDIVLDNTIPVAIHNIYGGFKEKNVRVFENKSPTLRTAAGGGHIPYFVKEDLLHTEKALEYMDRTVKGGRNHWDFKHHSDIRDDKSSTVVANFFKGVPYNVFKDWGCIRKFHPVECERLQTLPDGYTEGVSNTQRYKMIGNGWTVELITNLFKQLTTQHSL